MCPGYRTDHSFTYLYLQNVCLTNGRGYWKFNLSLLQDKQYVELVKTEIQNTVSDTKYDLDKQMMFEMIKLNIRGKTISYSSYRAKCKRNREQTIEKNIMKLRDLLVCSQEKKVSQQILEQIETDLGLFEKELQILRSEKIRAIALRTKVQYYEEGEKPTKFFCNMEKRKSLSKSITKLNINGQMIYNQKEILKELRSFYTDLYSSKCTSSSNLNVFLDSKNIKKLSEGDQNKCEGLISEAEAKEVLKNMKNGKVPGSDGFPAEFYKFFWNDIGKFLIDSLNESFITSKLSVTQRLGILTCLPKGEKPQEYLKNLRPITLLNVDYKILSGVLAMRMRKVLPNIISNSQKGFLKDRYIGENIRLVYDTIQFLNKRRRLGLILLIDFEKAFDSIEWEYIARVLKSYNFGRDFIKWFNILYTESCSCVINNGYLSEQFVLGRGCRQGDPLSPYLFILAIEPLAMDIKNNKSIQGVKVDKEDLKIGQYADDTFLLLDGSENSLREAIATFQKFYQCSGLKMNMQKTQVAWIGNFENDSTELCKDLNLTWVKQFKLLGIEFTNNVKCMIEINYNPRLVNIEKVLNMYAKRKISLFGKITVIKSLAIPILVYPMSVLPRPSKDLLILLQNIFRKFLWGTCNPRIALSQLEQDYPDGGLKLTNVSCLNDGLKLAWIKRTCQKSGDWQKVLEKMSGMEKKQIWELDIPSLKFLITKLDNPFWEEVLKIWIKYKSNFENEIDIRTYPIWSNFYIRHPNLIAKKRDLQERGIQYINNLLDESGRLFGYLDFVQQFNVSLNFVEFYSLIHSLPRQWRMEISEETKKLHQLNLSQKVLEDLLKFDKVCKKTYWTLMEFYKTIRRPIESKWSDSLGDNVSYEIIQKYNSANLTSTIDSKMRSFQFKILQRILTTNKFLKICKIKEDNSCSFCQAEIETLEHLFWECSLVKSFWDKLSNRLSSRLDLSGVLNAKSIILGVLDRKDKDVINNILVVCKKYIYNKKFFSKQLNVSEAIQMIKEVIEIEHNIMIRRDMNLIRFNQKWELVKECFS